MRLSGNFARVSIARFSSLIAPVPVEIEVVFRLSENRTFLAYFGYIMIISILLVAVMQPYLSSLLDSSDRKRVQILNQMAFSLVTLVMAIISLKMGGTLLLLLLLFLIIEIYYNVTYQTYASIAQDIIEKMDAGRYNGVSEILSQSPLIMGGILIAVLWRSLPLSFTLILSGTMGFLFTVPLLTLKYNGHRKTQTEHNYGNWEYFKRRKMAIVFIFLLNMPYVAVVSGNYLKPIFIAQVLSGTPGTLAESEIIYAFAAAISGSLVPLMISKIGEFRSSLLFSFIYVVGSVLMPLFPDLAIFFVLQVSHGIGNPGNRIARNTMVMRGILPEEIGRFNGSVQMLTFLARVIILLAYVMGITIMGVRVLMLGTGILVLASISAAFVVWKFDGLNLGKLKMTVD